MCSIKRGLTSAIFCIVVASLSGCASPEKELERVAKDWCQTIRASQVVPVYPLTEDLQPGDVFLVQRPIQTQSEEYKRRGFLPLDQMVVRLDDLGYDEFYASQFWDDTYARVPHARPSRTVPAGAAAPPFHVVEAPRAAFPSYSFEVQRGVGLKLAIPVQGVPIGFGFLRSDSATGSVTISDAYTYAASPEAIYARLNDWASEPEQASVLSRLQSANPDTTLYLRVVHRVYLTGGVLVTLVSNSASTTGVDVGAAPKVGVLDAASSASTVQNYKNASAALTDALRPTAVTMPDGTSKALPGGSLRIVEATARSVSLKENFDRPLVIGYLGYDFPILKHGVLGVPIATITQLETPATGETFTAIRRYVSEPKLDAMRQRINLWLGDTASGRANTSTMRDYLKRVDASETKPAMWTMDATELDLLGAIDTLKIP